MNYEEFSDQEINIKIAEINGVFWNIPPSRSKSGGWEWCKNAKICEVNAGKMTETLPDYCNNPLDAWPIMEANGIATVSENGVIIGATSDSQSFYDPDSCSEISCFGTKALRAAMIVFLVMQDDVQ